jgi:hypothetical protein
VRLLDHFGPERVLLEPDVEGLDRPGRGVFGRVEGACTEEPDSRGRSPADVDDDRVAERRLLADQVAPVGRDVRQLPVQPGFEARGQRRGDVGGEDRLGEEDRLDPLLGDELRDCVDAWLRKRCLEPGVIRDVDRRRAVLAGLLGQSIDARADDDAGDFERTASEAFWSSPP